MKTIQDPKLLAEKISEFQLDTLFDQSKQIPFLLQQYERSEIILCEGEEMKSLLFLVAGKVKVTSSIETGKSLLLRFCQPLSIIGDIELIQHVPVQSQIEAATDCLLIGLPFDYIQLHEYDNPKLLHLLLKHVTYKLQTCTTASRVNLLATVESRFASYLLSTVSSDAFGKELKTFNIEEIANLLGTTHRHLNRVIESLTQREIITKQKNAIHILNRTALEEIANGIRYQ